MVDLGPWIWFPKCFVRNVLNRLREIRDFLPDGIEPLFFDNACTTGLLHRAFELGLSQ
jgi:hypothetical protein